ncbi:glycosyltransferase family 2 protein [Vibrio metschnikovii]|nr:glycosyltransferase family 2 protein [Vibrio metschnikovii]
MNSLSVVIIGLNEEKNLKRCIESVLLGIRNANILKYELLYIDSGSRDHSIDTARKAGASSCYLLTGDKSASAARKVGEINAKYEWVLFLDGDMTLDENFLLSIKSKNMENNVAGYVGLRAEYYFNGEEFFLSTSNFYKISKEVKLNHIGGALLVSKEILNSSGGFDPSQKMWEESELLARLNSFGYEIIGIPIPFINHFNSKRKSFLYTINNYLSSRGTGYYYCQFLHAALKRKSFKSVLLNQVGFFIFFISLVMSFIFLSFIPLLVNIPFLFIKGVKEIIHFFLRSIWLPIYFVIINFGNDRFQFAWTKVDYNLNKL